MASDQLSSAYLRALSRWPRIRSVTADKYAGFVAARVGPSADLQHGDDLFLACGCVDGDPAAVAAFDEGPLRQACSAVARMVSGAAAREEVLQRTRMKLLVGSPPLIATYSGSGPLAAWTKIAAFRVAADLRREGGSTVLYSVPVEAALAPEELPDAKLAQARFGAQFEAALSYALSTLSADDRALLRLHFFERRAVDDLGQVLGVHRSTAARRLVAIRRQVREHTEHAMRTRFRITSPEFHSLLGSFSVDGVGASPCLEVAFRSLRDEEAPRAA